MGVDNRHGNGGRTPTPEADPDLENVSPELKTDHESQSQSQEQEHELPAQQLSTSIPSYPEGGKRAWMVVFGATMLLGCSFGYLSSFGTYEAYYQQNQLHGLTASQISWIGSVQTFFQYGTGLLSGGLFDLYGARVLIIPASISYVFSIMMTSLCTKYYQLILAQGVLGGLSTGFLFTPGVSSVNQYFRARRGMAVGVTVGISSLGGILFPIGLQHALYSKLGFGWGVRIIGFVILGLLSIACCLVKERLPPRRGTLLLPRAFKQRSYVFLVAGIFFSMWAMWVPYFYLPTFGIDKLGMRRELAFYLVSILNAASLFGRVIPGVMADYWGRLNMLVVTYAVDGVLLLCWVKVHDSAGLIVWTAIFGFFSGAIISLYSAALAQITPKPQEIGAYMGQATAIIAFAGLTGTPIAGALIRTYGFSGAAVFAGISMLTAMVLVASARKSYQPKWLAKA